MQDLLDPHAGDALLVQAAQVPARVRQPVGMVDTQAVDHPLAYEAEHLGVGHREDLGILLANPRKLVDVKKTPVPTCPDIDVEEASPQRLVAPPAVLLTYAHVVGHDVGDDAHARCG